MQRFFLFTIDIIKKYIILTSKVVDTVRAHPRASPALFKEAIVTYRIPANTRRWPKMGLMLGQRRRRWANVSATLGQRIVFAGILVSNHEDCDYIHFYSFYQHITYQLLNMV